MRSISKELPTCAFDDGVNPADRAVRMEGSLLPTHKTDAALKSSSLKAFLENGEIPETQLTYSPPEMKLNVHR